MCVADIPIDTMVYQPTNMTAHGRYIDRKPECKWTHKAT